MKSLNRTLSLVLVLAMCLGLMGIASAATFTDASTVQYKEAVEVMTGIGAINGYSDGTFKPTGTITREEAAKMVTYAVLSPAVASKLSVAATGFKDVASDRWSAPFIAYCVGKGIITGMGDGTFAPTANVTGYQLAKMLLAAVGYGAKGEFAGSSWELNVAVLGNKCKIFSGSNAADYSKAATREEAALYCFNAVTTPAQVSYSKLTESYSSIEEPGVASPDKDVYTIGEQVYPNLVTSDAVVDGVSGYVWYYKGTAVSSFVAGGTVLATSTNAAGIPALVAAANAKYIGYSAGTSVQYYLNGVRQTTDTDTANSAVANDGVYTATDLAAITGTKVKGVVVKFIDTSDPSDSKYDIISVTNDTVYTLSGDAATKTSGAVTTVTVPGLAISSVDVKNVSGYDGLKKGDVVMYHSYVSSGVTKYVITKCDSFTGVVNGVNVAGGAVVVNGTSYYVSELSGKTAVGDYSNIATVAGSTFYKDLCGNLVAYVASDTVNTLTNSVYVLQTGGLSFGTAQCKILKPDGTTSIVTVSKTAKYGGSLTAVTGTTMKGAAIADGELVANNLYTFTQATDGTYYLTVAKTNTVVSTASTQYITKGLPVFAGSGVATNGTVFVYYDATNGAKVYTGIANAPSFTTAAADPTSCVAYIKDSNGLATFVVATGGTYSAAVSADTKYVFAYAPATQIWTDSTTSYYQIKGVVNGELTTSDKPATLDMKSDLLSSKIGSLEAASTFESGKASALVADNKKISDTLIASVDAGNADGDSAAYTLGKIDDFSVAGTSLIAKTNTSVVGAFVLSADAKVFRFNGPTAATPVEEITLAELNTMTGNEYTLQAVKASSTDSSLKTLFVSVGSAVVDDAADATLASLNVNTASTTLYTTLAAAVLHKVDIAKNTAITAAPVASVPAATVTYSYMSTYTTTFTGTAFTNGTTKTTAAGSVTDILKITVTATDGVHTQDYYVAINVGA